MQTRPMHISLIALTPLVAAAPAPSLAGSPTPPPGPVAPTMKTLDEVEPRIAITQENTPGDAGSNFVIDQPGSYYFTGAPIDTARNAIRITSSDVSIDLMGHTLRGDPVAGADAIQITGGLDNLAVRNGAIADWGGFGVDLVGTALGDNAKVASLIVTNCALAGIQAPNQSTIHDCTVVDSVFGISVGPGSIVTNCISLGNIDKGISTSSTCLVSACNVSFNGDAGVRVSEGSTVIDCNIRACSPAIEASDDCLVTRNSCDSSTAGILVTGSDCRIDANQLSDCSTGIDVDAAGNLITRNSVTGGATQYDIVANNKVGPIVAAPNSPAVSGASGGAGLGTTDPWANFSY